jgi:hypothetical protein
MTFGVSGPGDAIAGLLFAQIPRLAIANENIFSTPWKFLTTSLLRVYCALNLLNESPFSPHQLIRSFDALKTERLARSQLVDFIARTPCVDWVGVSFYAHQGRRALAYGTLHCSRDGF